MYDRMKERCTETGIAQAHLCRAINQKEYYLRDAKKVNKELSDFEVKTIAKELRVTSDYLLGISDEKEKPAAPKNDGENKFESAIKTLCGEDQEKLALLMDSLSRNPERTKANFDLFLKTL